MEPDLSWWPSGSNRNGSFLCFVGDAKYKKLDGPGFRHADIYQMLAYCSAAGLPSGLLIYAAGEDEPAQYRINHGGKTIEVASLDLSGTPEAILAEVDRLAKRVFANAYGLPTRAPASLYDLPAPVQDPIFITQNAQSEALGELQRA